VQVTKINATSKIDQLEDDYKAERISRAEYLSRKSPAREGFHRLLGDT